MDLEWTEREEALAGELVARARAALYARPIALAGFMGVGKSTLGSLLAEALERPFHDTDSFVEGRAGRTVGSFFPAEEPEFRRFEAAAVAELAGRGPSVIALGGGALLDGRSRQILRERTLLVHLHVAWKDLRGDIPDLIATRPLLRGRTPAEIHRLYLARLATYRCAALRITVGRRGPAEAAAGALRVLRALSAPRGCG